MKKTHVALLAAVLLLDQISKWIVQSSMKINESIDVIPGFFRITYVQNTGAAWSMLEGRMIFFYIISVVFLIGMFYFYRHNTNEDVFTQLGVVLMIAGTLGNFADRLVLRYVRDFLDFLLLGYDFPVFNIADVSLCIGVGLLAISIIRETYGGRGICEQ